MNALQLHYTSCRRGQAAGAGFQTRARTPGILPGELREIERRGLYRPPRNAPQEPTPEQIEAELPRSLRFYTLESGRRALTRTGYVGQDYSGRWGNYFAHTLVFEGEAPGIWPVDFYEWEGWVDRLTPAADTEAEPAPLPPVDLAEIAPAESFTLDELRAFLREDPGRAALLEKMGRAVVLHAENGRPVLIRDTPLNGLYWIACVQKLFPPRHALNLGFSSYQYDGRAAAVLNATAGETDFTFGETERRYQFQLFDLDTGVQSEVPDGDGDHPALAVRWLVDDPALLDGFIEHTALFTHDQPDGELAHAARLFHLSRGGEGGLTGAQLSGMLEFVQRHTLPQARGHVLEMVLRAARGARGVGWGPGDHARLAAFLAGEARASGEPAHRSLAFAAWRSLLERCVLAGGGGTAEAGETWGEVRAAFEGADDELEAAVLDPALWETALPRLDGLAASVPALLLSVVATTLAGGGEASLERAAEVHATLLEALLRATADARAATRVALETLGGAGMGPGALAEACRVLAAAAAAAAQPAGSAARAAPAAVGAGLGDVLASASPSHARCVRAALDDAAGARVLYGEWAAILAASRDPLADYRRYLGAVLDRHPGYARACRGAVMASLLERLPGEAGEGVALEWLRSGELAALPPERRAAAVERAASAVAVEPPSPEALQLARDVARAAAAAGVALRPDRPRLVEALAALGTKGRELPNLELGGVGAALEGIDEAAYERFLDGFLLAALDCAHSRAEHRAVLGALYRTEHHGTFAGRYRDWFRAPRKGRLAEPFRVAIKFWLRYDREVGADGLAALAQLGEQECVRALAAMEPETVRSMRRELRLSGEPLDRWRTWEDDAEARRRGPLARLGRILFGR
ncbi:MAG TPA: hypothetical protein VFJ16_18800 [Longimicrobium sp.]|nr:hypothetical protein [Longimicrobium sp.]